MTAENPAIEMLTCSSPKCEASIKNHYWGKVNAQTDGWFFQKNDDLWCPLHIPSWVTSWRLKKANKA